MSEKKIIVHISDDYPDIMEPNKDAAIIRLIDGTPEYRHVVYSLNRVTGLSGLIAQDFEDDRIAVAYGALPKGVLWGKRLPEIGQWIIEDLKSKNIKPDLIQAHKFTVEGVIGFVISKALSCPLICNIHGGTDYNILKRKASSRPLYKKISRHAKVLLPSAPWPMELFNELLSLSKKKCTLLPVMPTINEMSPAPYVKKNKIITVFHLDDWRRKNFEGMVMAVDFLKERDVLVYLDVYGGGAAKSYLDMQKIIEQHELENHIRIMGPTPNTSLQQIMKDYIALILPSKKESFGLVYVEALLSGLPIMLNKKRGIINMLPTEKMGYGCDASDPHDIANGYLHLIEHQKNLKAGIEDMQAQGELDLFLSENILNTYKGVVNQVLGIKE